jgi:hypothetical protein
VGNAFSDAFITDSDLQNQRKVVNSMLRSQLVQKDEAVRKLIQDTSKLAEGCIGKNRKILGL